MYFVLRKIKKHKYLHIHIFMDSTRSPNLIDTSAKMYLFNSLQKSHINRIQYYNIWFNIGVFLLFVCGMGIFLYYRWKSRPSYAEMKAKREAEERYVLSRIRFYQDEKKKIYSRGNSSITDLPMGEHVPLY